MKNNIEKLLADAFSEMAPKDIFEKIALEAQNVQQERTTIMKENTKPHARKWIAASAACLVIAAAAIGTPYYINNYVPESFVDIDVNPGVEITTNKRDNVLDVVATNTDGEAIIDGMNLKNTDLKVAVNAIIGSMVQNGHIVDGENGMLVTVRNDDAETATRLRNTILSDIDASLSTNNVSASIINQTMTNKNDAQTFAKENNISVGKAVFVLNLAAKDSTLKAADLAKMSIKEIASVVNKNAINIRDIVDYDADDSIWENIADTIDDIDENTPQATNPPTGTAPATITDDKAKEIALGHAGISSANATFVRAQLDYDDGVQNYEIEFYSGNTEYDYEINASSGAIMSFDKDIENYAIVDKKPQTTPQAATITADRAKEIALNHAGVAAKDATFIKAQLDYDDGVQTYEVEFYSGNVEYDYEINAASGEIRSFDKDIENYAIPKQNQITSAIPPSVVTDAQITAANAKQIALDHAGISAANTTFIKAELDFDDGIKTYEIEFYSGNMEYEYEINAVSGAIISHSAEMDD